MKLGNAAKYIRHHSGLTQRAAAKRLGITSVFLCNVEHDRQSFSWETIDRFREVFGVDLYVTAWVISGEIRKLPVRLRGPARIFDAAWRDNLRDIVKDSTEKASP